MEGYDFGAPLVGTEPSARVTRKPVSVAVTHWGSLVPQRLFWTT
jgi:hypothetical protein